MRSLANRRSVTLSSVGEDFLARLFGPGVPYPLTSLGRTVIQHSWNLTDYPSAWPTVEEGTAEDQ